MTDADIRIHCDTSAFSESVRRFREGIEEFNRIFADRDKWHAQQEGEWPDRFTLLNRFVRTGVRPPYIFNN